MRLLVVVVVTESFDQDFRAGAISTACAGEFGPAGPICAIGTVSI